VVTKRPAARGLLDIIPSGEYVYSVWEIEYTDEFEEWWNTLNEEEQKRVSFSVNLLKDVGPALSFPHSRPIQRSKHTKMRELRSQYEGRPYRTFYAFDPRRTAILLIGGDKTGNNRFYDTMIPRADKIYDQYLREIQEEKEEKNENP
jgi:hypothetical protein